jgi:glycosyltransferase involved in cell wall biosynthesis
VKARQRTTSADSAYGGPRSHTLEVHHFGPHVDTVGGIATVIRTYTEHTLGGDRVYAHASWTPDSPYNSVRLAAGATEDLLRLPAGAIAHVHLSERGSFVREGWLLTLARRRGLATVATIHGARFMEFARAHERLTCFVLRRAALVLCLDPAALEFVRTRLPAVRCELLPNPVWVEEGFMPADETAEIALFAGEIGLRKGADVLARAWPRVSACRPTARCVFVGPTVDFDPPLLERLEVRGSVDAAQMRTLMRGARVIALPARAEAMPMVLTEAMSLGRPFVSTPVGGIPELADAGGLLVPVGDATSLADTLVDLLSNPGLARTIGERGREFCIATRSIEVIDARLRDLYRQAATDLADRP